MNPNPVEPTPSYKDFVYHLPVYLEISVYRANICAGNLVPLSLSLSDPALRLSWQVAFLLAACSKRVLDPKYLHGA